MRRPNGCIDRRASESHCLLGSYRSIETVKLCRAFTDYAVQVCCWSCAGNADECCASRQPNDIGGWLRVTDAERGLCRKSDVHEHFGCCAPVVPGTRDHVLPRRNRFRQRRIAVTGDVFCDYSGRCHFMLPLFRACAARLRLIALHFMHSLSRRDCRILRGAMYPFRHGTPSK